MTRVAWALLGAVLAAVVAARTLHLVTADTAPEPRARPWSQHSMEFVAWNGSQWTAWIRGGRFELLPRERGRWQRHANVSLAFTDWQSEPWQAKIDGEQFLLAFRGDWKGRTERASALRYRDWRGQPQVRTVAQLRR